MRVLIVEDEIPAAKRLQKMLKGINPAIEILEVLDAVKSTVDFLKGNVVPDLIFLDIHLADGDSFEIFKLMEVEVPIIFITAFDEFAVKAFKVNAIDYLLKPIKAAELKEALVKFEKRNADRFDWTNFSKFIEKQQYDKRFLIRLGQQLKMVEIADVAYFYREDRISFLVTKEGRRYPLDNSLESIDQSTDPKLFFRVNRKMIVNIKCIKTMYGISKSRVKLELTPTYDQEVIVSTERSPNFKRWLEGI